MATITFPAPRWVPGGMIWGPGATRAAIRAHAIRAHAIRARAIRARARPLRPARDRRLARGATDDSPAVRPTPPPAYPCFFAIERASSALSMRDLPGIPRSRARSSSSALVDPM
jgi:hypothetical protein